MDLSFVSARVGDDEFPEVEDVLLLCGERGEWGLEGKEIGLQLTGSRVNFNRRDPSRIYNAVFASSNRSGLIGCLLFNILLFGWKYSGCLLYTSPSPRD